MNVHSRLTVVANVTLKASTALNAGLILPPTNLCKSYQGLEPFSFFSFNLAFTIKLNLFLLSISRNLIGLPVYAGWIFFCRNWVFSIIHQSCSLCICKRVVAPKSPFFKYHKNLLPALIFWPWLYVSCPKSLRGAVGDWAAGGFGCSCARSRVRGDTIQPTRPGPAAAVWIGSSSFGEQLKRKPFEPQTWRGICMLHLWGFNVESTKAYW